jgi:hypothetical protein
MQKSQCKQVEVQRALASFQKQNLADKHRALSLSLNIYGNVCQRENGSQQLFSPK